MWSCKQHQVEDFTYTLTLTPLCMQALAHPRRLSMELLKHMLQIITACLPIATEHLIDNFEKVLAESHASLQLRLCWL